MNFTPNLEEILSELLEDEASLIIFCGAGISINSGLPSAIPLLDKILASLQIEPKDKDELIHLNYTLAMPFEVFFEIFFENTNEHQILDIFKEGEPSTNHLFILKCVQKKLTNKIYTTNFDLLIEKAFQSKGQELFVYKNEKEFLKVESSTTKCLLVKLHGSIDDIDSIRTTLSTIANKKQSVIREKIIDGIFTKSNEKCKILILGYSFSDIFDIVPGIEKIHSPIASLFIVEHNKDILNKENVVVDSLFSKPEEFYLEKFSGRRIKVNTDRFIKWIWEKIDTDFTEVKKQNEVWSKRVEEWINGFNSKYLNFTIIGQIFYRLGNYTLALKYHQKSLEANNNSNPRGEGASYNNIGLIQNDLKAYDNAIENFLKAKQIFDELNFHYGMAATLTNLGLSYIYLPDKIKSFLCLKKSLQISRNYDFREKRICESDALCNLGLLYEKNGDYPSAIYYFNQTLDIDKEGNKIGEAHTLSDLARVYKLDGNLKRSFVLFKRSNELAKKLGIISLIRDTQLNLVELSKAMY
jgi:NAD-dependent SIR2 family protein deacetylase